MQDLYATLYIDNYPDVNGFKYVKFVHDISFKRIFIGKYNSFSEYKVLVNSCTKLMSYILGLELVYDFDREMSVLQDGGYDLISVVFENEGENENEN